MEMKEFLQPNHPDQVWQGSHFNLIIIRESLVDLSYSRYLKVRIIFTHLKFTTLAQVCLTV